MISSRLLWASVCLILGGTLLLQMFGLVPASLWGALLKLWPVLLIALGTRMWFGPRATFGVGLPAAVVVLALFGAALTARAQSSARLQPLAQYLGGAESASVTLQLESAQLNLSALDGSVLLLDGGALTSPGETVGLQYVIAGGAGQLTLTQNLDELLAPFLAAPDLAPRWDVRLTPVAPLALDVRAASGPLRLDLASTRLTRLGLQTDSADAVIIFPARGLAADLHSASGDLTLTLPAGVPVRLTLAARPERVQAPPFLIREGGTLTSPGFAPVGDFLDLNVVSATGRVTVN